MRLQILSDLHIEHGTAIPPLAPDVDVMVMAGDFAPASMRRTGEAAAAWRRAKHILYVPGNHEYYGANIATAQQMLALDCEKHGLTLLDPGAVTLSGVRFIGATLWTDFRLDGNAREMSAHAAAGSGLNDFRGTIRGLARPGHPFTTWEAAHRHRQERAFIESELAAARAAGQEAVVITHHAPSPRSVHPKYRGDPLNAGFASNLEDVIVEHQPALWIHGHMHDAVDVRLGMTRILANPHGYSEIEAADFRPALVVDL